MKYEDFLPNLGFCEEELSLLAEADEKCRGDVSQARKVYDEGDEAFAEYLIKLSEAREIDINILNLYLYLRFSEDTYKIFKAHGISDEDFFESMACWKIVSDITFERTGHYGVAQTTYRSWQRRCVNATIFRLGRLEFETITSRWNVDADGITLREGEPCLSVHIPRRDKFDEASCEAAYDRARKFFKKHFNMDKIVFLCHSWLMDPWLCEALSETSTIVNFQKKYTIFEVDDNADSAIGWIFGKKLDNIEDYAEDTTIRRAAKKKLLSGERIGTAYGARL